MNKNILKFSSLALLALAMTFTSCKKDAEEALADAVPAVPDTPKGAQSINPTDLGTKAGTVDGVLVGVKSVTTTETAGVSFDLEIGLGVAYFTETTGDFSTFANAGVVTLNSETLAKQENNSYVFSPSTDKPTGISFTKGVDWLVKGAGSFSPTTYKGNRFPSTPELKSEKVITKSSDYDLSFKLKYVADTVICSIYSGSTTITKGFKPTAGTQSVSFTAAEMKDLSVGATGGMIQIAAMNFYEKTKTGKNYLFISETVTTAIVEVK